MYYRTQTFRYSDALLQALLGALKTVPGGPLLTTPKIVLYSSGPTPGGANAVTDFTESTWHGYAPVAVTLSGPVLLADGSWALIACVEFVATTGGPLNPETIKGYILTDGATTYYGGEDLVGNFAISAVGQFLELDLVLPLVSRPTVNA